MHNESCIIKLYNLFNLFNLWFKICPGKQNRQLIIENLYFLK